MRQGHLYAFGPFRLDSREGVLLREGKPVALTPKAFETLVALVENAGHILEKEELLKQVWPDTFVEEATLAKNISTLRQALGDTGEAYLYIETIAKRGYRFIAAVERLHAESESTPQRAAPEPGVAPSGSPARAPDRGAGPSSRRTLVAAVALTLVLIFAAAWGFRYWRGAEEKTPVRRIALVVLPFANLTGNEADDYLSDGLTEDMISRLGRVAPERLAVIARTTAMRYKNAELSAAEIGKELAVDYVLEGSVRREADRVRITAQLVHARDQTHVWAENYDREITNILPLQGEVAEAIARAVHLWITPERPGGPSPAQRERAVEPEAHELYLRARYFWNKRSPENVQKAIELLQKAIEIEPTYARAWSALAESYVLQNEYGGLPAAEAFTKARAAAQRALEIEPALAEAHATIAHARATFDWDFAASEKDFRRVIELNPNYATARHWFAYGPLFGLGRFAEAREQLLEAQKLDPFSTSIAAALGQTFYLERRYAEALTHFERALRLTPRPNFGIYFHIALAHSQMGQHAQAIAAAEEGIRLAPSGDGLEYLAYAQARAGQAEDARKTLARLLQRFRDLRGSPYIVAGVYAALGDSTQSLEWLRKAAEGRTTRLIQVASEPMFDPLRQNAAFLTIVQGMGLRAPAKSVAAAKAP